MSEKKFWKKIRNNMFYLALTGIICAILLFFLVLYLAVPSYSFAEIEPFNGEFVYNPYSDINRINYFDFRSESIENHELKSMNTAMPLLELVISALVMKRNAK